MADRVWKGVYPYVLGRSRQLSLNKFFDPSPSAPSMRKVNDGEKKKKKKKKEKRKKKRVAFLVATTSLPAVYRLNGYAQTTTAGPPHARAKIGTKFLVHTSSKVGTSFEVRTHFQVGIRFEVSIYFEVRNVFVFCTIFEVCTSF